MTLYFMQVNANMYHLFTVEGCDTLWWVDLKACGEEVHKFA